MSLNLSGMNNEFMNGFSKTNAVGIQAGTIIQNGIAQYTQSLMDPAGGNFTGMPGLSSLGPSLGEIFEKRLAAGSQIGQEVAKKIDECFLTLKTARYMAHVTILPGLLSDLMKIFSQYPAAGATFGKNLSTAINTYTLNIKITAIIPGSPPVVVTGPPA